MGVVQSLTEPICEGPSGFMIIYMLGATKMSYIGLSSTGGADDTLDLALLVVQTIHWT
jgi:hypothetical protein